MLQPMKPLLLGTCAVLVLFGCSKKSDESPKNSEAQPPAIETPTSNTGGEVSPEQGLAAAKMGASTLATNLKSRLMSAMQEGGPEGALHVCAQEAQDLTAKSASPRLRVGRSSLRIRNPKNADAPDWVRAWLTETGERKVEGIEGVEEVVDGTARVLMPLATGGLCLACHGDPATQSDSMKALLASSYPEDKATGYQPGDLRGALWAEYDLRP